MGGPYRKLCQNRYTMIVFPTFLLVCVFILTQKGKNLSTPSALAQAQNLIYFKISIFFNFIFYKQLLSFAIIYKNAPDGANPARQRLPTSSDPDPYPK